MNKMNLPPPFGPLRKRPAMPQGGDVQQKDAVKFYGESQIKGKMEEEEEEGEKEEVEGELMMKLSCSNVKAASFGRSEIVTFSTKENE